jgi:hypothetical protein
MSFRRFRAESKSVSRSPLSQHDHCVIGNVYNTYESLEPLSGGMISYDLSQRFQDGRPLARFNFPGQYMGLGAWR